MCFLHLPGVFRSRASIYIMFAFFIAGTYNKELTKMVYLENRRFLPSSSPLRKQSTGFPSGEQELQAAPAKRSFEETKDFHIAYD